MDAMRENIEMLIAANVQSIKKLVEWHNTHPDADPHEDGLRRGRASTLVKVNQVLKDILEHPDRLLCEKED